MYPARRSTNPEAGGQVWEGAGGRGRGRAQAEAHTGSTPGYARHVGLMRLLAGSLRASRTTMSLKAAS